MKQFVLVLILVFLCAAVPRAEALVLINEFLADPAADLTGDANADGTRSGSDDEFIEILNYGPSLADISGWSLADGVEARHVFPADTVLQPYSLLTVFGGGAPSLSGINWQVASTGTLGLNNTSDTISLFGTDAALVDQIVYGSDAGQDQSLTRFPDGEGADFVLHAGLEAAGGALFSPGTSVDGRVTLAAGDGPGGSEGPTVPEPATLLCFGLGLSGMLAKRRF